MKRFVWLFGLLGLMLMLFQCNSEVSDNQKGTQIDTVIVRDTVIVVEKHVFVNAAKMNVLYIGVENLIDFGLAGINPNDLRVTISGAGGNIKKQGDTQYVVTVTQPGEARIKISGGELTTKEFIYRVKRIPDPVARLSKSSGGEMGNGEFKAQGGLGAFLDNFDFEATCQIQGFKLTMIAKRQDPIEVVNAGARFNDLSRSLINRAKPGDVYIFSNVKARCPGDNVGRPINSLAFFIK